MSLLIAFIISVFVYAAFVLLLALNFGGRLKEVSVILLLSRVCLLVSIVYLIQYFRGNESLMGNVLGSFAYLFVFLIIGSLFGESFFWWLSGIKRKE